MIRDVFDTVGAWGGIRLGLWVGAAAAALIWAGFFYTPVLHIGPEAAPAASDFEVVTAIATVIGLLAAFGLGVIAGREHRRRTVRRLCRSVEALTTRLDTAEADLLAERAVSAYLAKPTADLLADVYGDRPLEDPRA
ncbi:hypothetical protein [Nocardiopsis synnemataformans]|uniref:hypothetical protein n=1 Tax=Nocardiopsis synnemataformans TaxID=61305 RepID=UPI003EB925F5